LEIIHFRKNGREKGNRKKEQYSVPVIVPYSGAAYEP
jgi:hypothetical protein